MTSRAASFLFALALASPVLAAPKWRPVATRGGVLRASPVFGVLTPSGTPMVFGGCLVGHCDYGEPANFLASPQLLEGAEWGSASDGPGVRYEAAGGVVGGKFVLHGGQWSEFGQAGVSAETWTFDGSAWHKLAGTNHPGPRFGAAFAVDGTGNRAYLFGGRDEVNADRDETWTWANGGWTQVATSGTPPDRRVFGALAWDGEGFVYFGGQDSFATDDMYRLVCAPQDPLACTWTPIEHDLPWPAARSMHAMAFDAGRNVVAMFGGRIDGQPTNETWEWNGTRWAKMSFSTAPQARYAHAMARDPVNGRLLVLGGATYAAASALDDVWEYVEVTTPAPDAGSPGTPDAGSPGGADAGGQGGGNDAGGGPGDTADAGTPDQGGGDETGGDSGAHGRYGCQTAGSAALVLPFVVALARRRRRS